MQVINRSSRAVGFFDLPQKLRDRVYMIVLQSEIKPPRNPIQQNEKDRGTKSAYAVQPRDIASFGLLYACWQTRYEMSHAIARQSATEKNITYELDCLVKGHSIIPTWTALPAPPCHLRHIVVTVRAFHSASPDHIVSALIPPLLDLVNQFFERNYSWWGQFCSIPLIVDTLTVHMPSNHSRLCSQFLTQLKAAGGLWRKVRRVRLSGMQPNGEWVVIPSWYRRE